MDLINAQIKLKKVPIRTINGVAKFSFIFRSSWKAKKCLVFNPNKNSYHLVNIIDEPIIGVRLDKIKHQVYEFLIDDMIADDWVFDNGHNLKEIIKEYR